MADGPSSKSVLPNFRRALGFLWPHRHYMIIGLLCAVGVATFYTFSISSIVPVLKVIFAENETLLDWVHRVETERRLGIAVTPDAPDDPNGLSIDHVRPESRAVGKLHTGDRLVAIGDQKYSAYQFLQIVATNADKTLESVTVVGPDGAVRVVPEIRLRSYHSWSVTLRYLASFLPREKDAESKLATLAMVMGALVIVQLLGGVFRVLNEGLVAVAVQRSMHDIRTRLADHVLRLPLSWHTNQAPGDTLGRFATDISKVEVGLTTLFGKTFREPIKAVGVIALALAIDWKLMLVALIGLPIGGILMRWFGRQVKKAQRRASASWGKLLDHLGEKLAGIRIVKAYNMQAEEARRFAEEGRTLTRAQTHIEWVDAATNPALELLAVMGVALFVLWGGSRVFLHQLEPHVFFAAVVCIGGIFDPLRKMGNVWNRLQQADASGRRLFDLLDIPTEEQTDTTSGRTLRPLREVIEIQNVSFAYPSAPTRPVLANVSLTVRRGQVVALVGPNGSGKTTLVSLLLRFYKPTGGRILIDGQDIAEASIESLRAQIGLVTQDAVVFSDTVAANIGYGAGDVPMETIETAAQLAHVDDFVRSLRVEGNGRLKSGFEAHIDARSLSGGQRQRIALARAILRDPPILVLDEATSQVDSESERKIQEALDDVIRGRTTFIIAHRYSTISRADVIVVLNEGRVVAVGRHADLLTTSPFYVALCETQFAHALTT